MAQPRIRDLLVHLTTLPASMLIAACLFLPHTKSCQSGRQETPFESDLWIAIAPIVVLGVLPLLWHVSARVRRRAPELVLSFTLIVLSLLVITIPVAIYLVWGYAKRTFRGELLVAMCSTACIALWMFVYPLLTLFDQWLPAADATWIAASLELVGMLLWIAAASTRPSNADENPSLHVAKLTGVAAPSGA